MLFMAIGVFLMKNLIIGVFEGVTPDRNTVINNNTNIQVNGDNNNVNVTQYINNK